MARRETGQGFTPSRVASSELHRAARLCWLCKAAAPSWQSRSRPRCVDRERGELGPFLFLRARDADATLAAAAIDRDLDPLKDLVGRAHGVDGDEDALEAIVVEQRRGLLAIDLHAVSDRL